MLTNFFTFSRFVLFVALCISAIAAYYSVIGLTAIFAGAVIPIIVMGGILEIAKITTTVWLHKYWNLASWSIKTYLTTAVIALACLTSMGIFGLLSKAHSDTGLVSGDVSAKVALIDEKIKTQRDNIDASRKALQQMDEQVNQRLTRGDSEQGAERAVQIRRQQASERTKLQKEIGDAQIIISKLNEERAPIAASQRKVEAEVGPIKYIAALIYGDNPDANLLERAVRWVIIMIVIVFDPLAIILILAANNSLRWEREHKKISASTESVSDQPDLPLDETTIEASTLTEDVTLNDFNLQDHPYLFKTPTNRHPPGVESVPPQVYKEITEEITEEMPVTDSVVNDEIVTVDYAQSNYDTKYTLNPTTIQMLDESNEEVIDTVEKIRFNENQEYVHYEGKLTSIQAIRGIRPDLILNDQNKNVPVINFGTQFPREAFKEEFYIRVDTIPHKVYVFDSKKWVNVDKNSVSNYLQNTKYVRHLINQLETGEYRLDDLTDSEQNEISNFLKNN